MFYCIQNGKPVLKDDGDFEVPDDSRCFGFIDYDKSAEVLGKLGLNIKPLMDCTGGRLMFFENYDGFDFMSLDLPGFGLSNAHEGNVYIYIRKNVILFILEKAPKAEKILQQISGNLSFIGFDHLLNNFFEKLIEEDCEKIDDIELEISDLENSLLDSHPKNCVKEIAALRRSLLMMKRYYEQFLNLLDELIENENETLSEITLQYFRVFYNKIDRRYHTLLNLRDYVTQVREAYQAEIDIGLNNIMKIFTVLTAVFLPLTLLVGWYGMNLQMPEYSLSYGYPAVIALAVAIVVLTIGYFKKKKWF